MTYFEMVNSWPIYVICGSVLVYLALMCLVMFRKSYALGIKTGMKRELLNQVAVSSASFTVLPAISVLIGMIALSGTLGVPMAWFRLSVIGALQYELQVTDISLQALGFDGVADLARITPSDFATVALVMAVGIIGGLVCCIFFLKQYLKKVQASPKSEASTQKSFSVYATAAMFIGLCSAYFGAYIGDVVANRNMMPLVIACISGVTMLLLETLAKKGKMAWLNNFAIAASMLVGMAFAVMLNGVI